LKTTRQDIFFEEFSSSFDGKTDWLADSPAISTYLCTFCFHKSMGCSGLLTLPGLRRQCGPLHYLLCY